MQLKEKSSELEAHWRNEKEIITNIRNHKKDLDKLKQQADIEERRGDLQKVAEIRYGQIPITEEAIKKQETKLLDIQKGRVFSKKK